MKKLEKSFVFKLYYFLLKLNLNIKDLRVVPGGYVTNSPSSFCGKARKVKNYIDRKKNGAMD